MTTEKDTDVYMKKIRKRATETGTVMEKIKSDRLAELDKMHVEAEMEEVKAKIAENKAKIRDAQRIGQPLQLGQAQNFASLLFAGRKPEEVKEILSSLTEDEIDKLAYMTVAMTNNNFANFRAFLRQPSTGAKEVLEAVKTGVQVSKAQAPSSSTAKEVLEAVKLGLEVGKAKSTPTPEVGIYDKFIKPVLDETKAMRQELAKERMFRLEKEIAELKNRPGFAEELAGKKAELEAFRDMFGGGTAPNIEMQKMSLDHEKWKVERDWEMMKWQQDMKLKQQSERDKMKLIEKIAVPTIKRIGPVLDAAVSAGKQKISRMGVPRGVSTKQMANAFLCPKCAEKDVETIIDVSDRPDVAVCPTCKARFPKEKAKGKK